MKFKMNMTTSVLLAVGFSLSAGIVVAQTCVSNNCAALSFNKTEGNCMGDVIRCPFDTSKVFCKEYVMAAGDILYSDKTTLHYSMDSDKTPIGVVVDPSRRLAMALNCSLKQWANNGYNKSNISGIPDSAPSDTKTDFNGKSYTKLIVNECGSNCPAAYYAYNYTTTGTSKGDWFLPSGGQLWLLEQNKSAIKMGLAKAGGKLPYGNGSYTYLESSNEGPDKYSDFKMSVYMDFKEDSTSYMDNGNKYKSAYLDKCFSCPFISF